MRLPIVILTLFFCCNGFAQDSTVVKRTADSLHVLPAAVAEKDSSIQSLVIPSFDSCRNYIIKKSVGLNLFVKPDFFIEKEKQTTHGEWLFYYMLGLLLLFGLLRLTYLRYFNDMFRVFFKTSLRVNQIREQLTRSGLQSLLFNIFFAVSAGTYIYLLASYFKVPVQLPGLLFPLVAAAIIAGLYLGKYIFLRFSGWLFSMRNATETYSFIVFLINKIIGIVILPFMIVIAFGTEQLAGVAITISLAIITGLFLYRFLRAYNPVQADVKVVRFHFFIFFLAFEMVPLLLIYKLFIRFL